jgi:hypothetical protein
VIDFDFYMLVKSKQDSCLIKYPLAFDGNSRKNANVTIYHYTLGDSHFLTSGEQYSLSSFCGFKALQFMSDFLVCEKTEKVKFMFDQSGVQLQELGWGVVLVCIYNFYHILVFLFREKKNPFCCKYSRIVNLFYII